MDASRIDSVSTGILYAELPVDGRLAAANQEISYPSDQANPNASANAQRAAAIPPTARNSGVSHNPSSKRGSRLMVMAIAFMP